MPRGLQSAPDRKRSLNALCPFPDPNRSNNIKTDSIAVLTSLRFLAAIWVVFFHLITRSEHFPLWLRGMTCFGQPPVTFFFALSGFIITYSYSNKHQYLLDSRKFWVARLARIYPLYLLANILIAPFVLFVDLEPDPFKLGLA